LKRYVLVLSAYLLSPAVMFSAQQVNVYMNVNFDTKASLAAQQFKEKLPLGSNSAAYTKVPRGLIVSIADEKFFQHNSAKLTDEGKELLNIIAGILKNFSNKCAIETHTDEIPQEKTAYRESWEISIRRANVITEYLIKCCNINTERLYPIGFGEVMPFNDSVSSEKFTDNRIDFVIFDYSAKR